MAPLTPEDFRRATGVSRETITRLETFVDLLVAWQARINLVSSASLSDVWRRHILDSAQLKAHLPRSCRSLVDLGSGAGFPGFILAILGVRGVHLVDSDGRKCAFLTEAARQLGTDVTIHRHRIEDMTPFLADTVTARGCAPFPKLLTLAARFCGPETRCLFLKGERSTTEGEAPAPLRQHLRISRVSSLSDPLGVVIQVDGLNR